MTFVRLVAIGAAAAGAWTLPASAQLSSPSQPPVAVVQSTIAAARAAARADRNREAADLFARALAQAPERRRELLQEYADQLNYSGRSRAAIPLFLEALQAPRSAEDRLRLLKGLGLAYLWTDQPSLARPVFETLVHEQPNDEDASRNLGRALSWSGRQREAVAHLQRHLAAHPGDDEARVIMAQAQVWLGRPDRAAHSLAEIKSRRADAEQLAAALDRSRAPHTIGDLQRSTQSDHLDIRAERLGQTASFAQGRGMAGVRIDHIAYDQQDGGDSARVDRPMLLGRYRFSDALEVNAEVGQERIRPLTGPDHSPVVYASWLTLWPNDLWRFDLSTNRNTFDNLKSLRLGITAHQVGGSTDFTPTERQRYTVRLEHADYSDGNTRRNAQFEAEYRWRTHPDAWFGLRHTRIAFARQLDNGYFNPLDFESTQATARVVWHPDGDDGRWDVAAAAAIGREHANPDGSKAAHDASLRVGWRFDPRTRLEARAQRFSSLTTSSGFARTTFGVSLDRSW
jgi:tetratricopeptide (TPR) repeat protein